MRFRVYYGDGSTFAGEGLDDALRTPQNNVQVIIVQNPDSPRGWNLVRSKGLHGYYVWRNGGWEITDEAGVWDYRLMHTEPRVEIYGRTVKDEAFHACVTRAVKEGLG
jgi:hypothetical protein